MDGSLWKDNPPAASEVNQEYRQNALFDEVDEIKKQTEGLEDYEKALEEVQHQLGEIERTMQSSTKETYSGVSAGKIAAAIQRNQEADLQKIMEDDGRSKDAAVRHPPDFTLRVDARGSRPKLIFEAVSMAADTDKLMEKLHETGWQNFSFNHYDKDSKKLVLTWNAMRTDYNLDIIIDGIQKDLARSLRGFPPYHVEILDEEGRLASKIALVGPGETEYFYTIKPDPQGGDMVIFEPNRNYRIEHQEEPPSNKLFNILTDIKTSGGPIEMIDFPSLSDNKIIVRVQGDSPSPGDTLIRQIRRRGSSQRSGVLLTEKR